MTTTTLPPKPTRSKIDTLAVRDLVVDHTYQRPVKASFVKKLIANFDPDLIGIPTVAERDGTYYVIDGQHRVAAMQEMGLGDRRIRCEVFVGSVRNEEAKKFVGRNDRLNVQSLDAFIARVEAGDANAVAISRILNKHNLHLGWDPRPGNFAASKAAEKVYVGAGTRNGQKMHGDELDWTIATIITAWGPVREGVQGFIVEAIGLMYLRFGSQIDRARLAEKMAKIPSGPSGLLGKARGVREYRGGTIPHAAAEYLTTLYNKGLRTNRLPEWRS